MSTLNFKKINNILALVCTLALIVIAASIISKVVWQIIDKEASFPISKAFSNDVDTGSSLSLPENLFGSLKSTEKINHSKIEITRLNLVLIGILSGQENSSVIISKDGAKEKIYQINDLITPNTVLKEIFSQYVILDRNGSIEKLEIRREKMDSLYTDTPLSFKITQTNKLKLKNYLKDLKKNPDNLFDILSVEPNFINGKLRGFIIAPGPEKTLFKELGFQKNDIIININNTDLNNLSEAIKLRDILVEEKIFNITIDRKGLTKFLIINLN
jgi:type II secretion system protein C